MNLEIKSKFFPTTHTMTPELYAVIKCFEEKVQEITSSDNLHLTSNQVLAILQEPLERIDFKVEKGKCKGERIELSVVTNDNGVKTFFVDALSKDGKTIIEIESGRGVHGYQFLKDIFSAFILPDVEYLVIAVLQEYKSRKSSSKRPATKDYDVACAYLDALFSSPKFTPPLKGILIVGY